MSMTMLPSAPSMGSPAPIAAAIGSSTMSTVARAGQLRGVLDGPLLDAGDSAGTQIVTCGLGWKNADQNERLFMTFLMKYASIASVTSKSAMTPSRNGRMALMCAGVLPSIWRAPSPTARTLPVFTSVATTRRLAKDDAFAFDVNEHVRRAEIDTDVKKNSREDAMCDRVAVKDLARSRTHARIRARFEHSGRLHQRRHAARALYLRAEVREHFLETLVTAVDVFQADDLGLACGAEGREHEGGARANVRRLDRSSRKRIHAFYDRGVARDFHVGAHARELVDVRKARVEDRLFDHARAGARAEKRQHRRLQVRRKARIGRRENFRSAFDAARADARPIRAGRGSTPHSSSFSSMTRR